MDFNDILKYSHDLSVNNNRTWFHENHTRYEKVRKDFLGFLDMLRFAISKESPEIAKSVMYMEPKDWMYRIAKDMRFHKNGPPYNPAFRAYISPDRKSWKPNGYYIHLFPASTIFGTGLWCSSTAQMNSVRAYISKNYSELEMLLKKSKITITGDKMKTVPRGFSADDPAAEYLKMRNWQMMFYIPDEDIDTFEDFCILLRGYVRAMEPLRMFLMKAASYVDSNRPEFEW
ncbi:MAG: DUF2461 domain-containing protein [Ruminococcaceae bacterium]|nr:DUF2461 domain-containing protein [Oscillospiraceae bacterium]